MQVPVSTTIQRMKTTPAMAAWCIALRWMSITTLGALIASQLTTATVALGALIEAFALGTTALHIFSSHVEFRISRVALSCIAGTDLALGVLVALWSPVGWLVIAATLLTCILDAIALALDGWNHTSPVVESENSETPSGASPQVDALTGLAVRSVFEANTDLLLHEQPTGTIAVATIDLRQFKDINDALGHERGDELLRLVAERLRHVGGRSTTYARLSGSEFAASFEVSDAADALHRTHQLLSLFEHPFVVHGTPLHIRAAAGVVVATPQQRTSALLRQADLAMLKSKRVGASATLYTDQLGASDTRQRFLVTDVHQAIIDNNLEVWFQPCVDLFDPTAVKAEALIRWRHETHGLLPPLEFIETAAKSGLMGSITKWLIDAIAHMCDDVRNELPTLVVAANLSSHNLHNDEVIDQLNQYANRLGPDRLELEITESELMNDPLRAASVVRRLKELGYRCWIDDFGTGYSSLAYLKNLPVAGLKIDRSFVSTLDTDHTDQAIVRSTVDLAHRLGLAVTAEGVPNAAAASLLKSWGCDAAQGYWLSHPVPASQLAESLRTANERLHGSTLNR